MRVRAAWTPCPDSAIIRSRPAYRGCVGDGDLRLAREFERGIREGGSPAPNLEDGVRCQAVLDAVRESAREGRRVAVAAV